MKRFYIKRIHTQLFPLLTDKTLGTHKTATFLSEIQILCWFVCLFNGAAKVAKALALRVFPHRPQQAVQDATSRASPVRCQQPALLRRGYQQEVLQVTAPGTATGQDHHGPHHMPPAY